MPCQHEDNFAVSNPPACARLNAWSWLREAGLPWALTVSSNCLDLWEVKIRGVGHSVHGD